MRLFEAIIDANHRALAGDQTAGLHPAEFADELPIVALTCVDPRLNPLLPEVLGVPKEQFIWLRNAGNIVTGPLSSTMRSLALACAVKGGKEIVIIGHTDCQVSKTTTMQLIEQFRALGIPREKLPDNLNEFFGIFASDRQNVIKAAEIVRQSPLISPKMSVHGLLVDVESGQLEWLVNGYQAVENVSARLNELMKTADQTPDGMPAVPDFEIGEFKYAEAKIGEVTVPPLAHPAPTPVPAPVPEPRPAPQVRPTAPRPPGPPPPARPLPPTRVPVPPVIRPRAVFRKGPR